VARPPLPLKLRWGVPGPGVALPDDEVHVALTLLERPDSPVAELTELLSAEERAQALRFRFEADQKRFAVSRGMLRLWLSRYLGTPPQELRFDYGPNGKPSVEGAAAAVQFNLSHAGGLVAFAITRIGPIGIDLERVHDMPGWQQISVLCFAPEERALLAAYPEAERQQHFFRLWTRHEAWLKAWGVGLGGEPGSDGGSEWASPGATGRMETFVPAPGYIATVAVIETEAAGAR
jgi:4'-phosphopantetheinyl transferase